MRVPLVTPHFNNQNNNQKIKNKSRTTFKKLAVKAIFGLIKVAVMFN